MKKIYILAIFMIFIRTSGFSQILTSTHPTLNYNGPDSLKLIALCNVENTGPDTLHVLARRFSSVMTPGHYSYFCWTVCYDTSVSVSPDPVIIPPGGMYSLFEGWLGPDNTPGHDEVTYHFYDMNGLSDTLSLTFVYDFGVTGINELSISKYALNISGPNPASTFTNISYSLSGKKDARLILTNLLGSKVSETYLGAKSNSIIVPVSDLKSGIYIYSLVVDGVIVNSKKLIVNH